MATNMASAHHPYLATSFSNFRCVLSKSQVSRRSTVVERCLTQAETFSKSSKIRYTGTMLPMIDQNSAEGIDRLYTVRATGMDALNSATGTAAIMAVASCGGMFWNALAKLMAVDIPYIEDKKSK